MTVQNRIKRYVRVKTAMKNTFFIQSAVAMAIMIARVAAAAPTLDANRAKAAFAEAQSVSDNDGGRLWNKKLYGAMFFVDPETRAVIANEPDAGGVLHDQDGVFVGTLPQSVIIANAPTEWGGKRWTMLIWSTLPVDTTARRIVLGHESFHRIQPELGLMAPDSPNPQLDTPEGRLWLQLEWRALAAALAGQGPPKIQAIRDALAFRDHRHALFPASAKTEASLEVAEGIPEYTGTVAGAVDLGSARWRVIAKLADPDQSITFVRSFAYTSGPPYGLLLDERRPGWRSKLSTQSDLGRLLAATLAPHAPVPVEARASVYGKADIRVAETERASRAEAIKARYRSRLVDGPTLFLPGGKKFAFSFNPSALVSLTDATTVYPTFHATAEWGTLDVTDGVLVPTDFSGATVAAPSVMTGTHLQGPGWTLDLTPGWKVAPGAKSDSYMVKRE
jgi:hypothetical protein